MSEPLEYDFPLELGKCVDLGYDLQQMRLDLQRRMEAEIKEIAAQEKALQDHMFQLFGNDKLKTAGGDRAVANLKPKWVAKITDWNAYYNFIYENKAFELLHKRPTTSAIFERRDAGEVIPGVEFGEIFEIKISGR